MDAALIYPVDQSRSGTNTHYLWCDNLGRRNNYAACLHVINAHAEGKLPHDMFGDCASALNGCRCPAAVMREREIAAGKALFYEPRVFREPVARPLVAKHDKSLAADKTSESYLRGRYGAQQASAKVSEPRSSPAPKVTTPDYADLVTQMAKDEVDATPAPAPTPAPASSPIHQPIRPLPGETPLEFARRRRAALAG